MMMNQVGRFIHQRGGSRKFRIHKAFHPSLALTEQAKKKFTKTAMASY